MKSLLVDALRRADDDPQDDANADPGDASPVAPSKEPPICSEDLSLFETQSVAVNDSNVPQDRQSDDGSMPGSRGTETDGTEPTSPSQIPQPTALTRRNASHRGISKFTPLACLVVMLCVATGTYFYENWVSGSISETMMTGQDDRLDPLYDDAMSLGGQQPYFELRDIAVPQSNPIDETLQTPRSTPTEAPAQVHKAQPDTGASVIRKDARDTVSDHAYDMVVTGYTHYRSGDLKRAESIFLDALRIEPNHRDAHIGLAAIYQKSGRTNAAQMQYQKLLTLDPTNTIAASALLALRAEEQDWDIESDVKHLLQRFPRADHLHHTLGQYYVSKNRWADARHAFMAAYELAPESTDYNYNLAVSLERLGEIQSARRHYEIALTSAGDHSNIDRDIVETHLDQLAAASGELQ